MIRLIPAPTHTFRHRFYSFAGIAILGGGIKLAGMAQSLIALVPACPLYSAFHIPCVTCGGTRAVISLGNGEILAAFLFNPLVVVAIAAAFIFALGVLVAGFFGRGIRIDLRSPVFAAFRYAVILGVALNWFYLFYWSNRI